MKTVTNSSRIWRQSRFSDLSPNGGGWLWDIPFRLDGSARSVEFLDAEATSAKLTGEATHFGWLSKRRPFSPQLKHELKSPKMGPNKLLKTLGKTPNFGRFWRFSGYFDLGNVSENKIDGLGVVERPRFTHNPYFIFPETFPNGSCSAKSRDPAWTQYLGKTSMI